jgi:hypothetical protein
MGGIVIAGIVTLYATEPLLIGLASQCLGHLNSQFLSALDKYARMDVRVQVTFWDLSQRTTLL